MTLNQLRYFCTASRCHSITKAAEELYVTQPTISMAIRDLEIEFGISLFSRKGNQLILTCLLYTSPSPRDVEESRMPSSA